MNFRRFIEDWTLLLGLYILSLILIIFFLFFGSDTYRTVLNLVIWVISSLFLISGIIHFKNSTIKGIISIIAFIFGIGFSSLLLVILPFFYKIGEKHLEKVKKEQGIIEVTIPDDVPMSKPIALYASGRPNKMYSEKIKTANDLVLYVMPNRFEFKYDLWMQPTEQGYAYLQLTEVSSNTPITNPDFILDTRIEVENSSDAVQKMELSEIFTLPETSFNLPYAAKVEVWFVPNSTKTPQKVAEKNYLFTY